MTKRDGELTGQIAEGKYWLMIYAMAEIPDTVMVDVVQLKYGQVEETMAGPMYRHTLGDVVSEEEHEVDEATWMVALQADRSIDPLEWRLLPPELQPAALSTITHHNWLGLQ